MPVQKSRRQHNNCVLRVQTSRRQHNNLVMREKTSIRQHKNLVTRVITSRRQHNNLDMLVQISGRLYYYMEISDLHRDARSARSQNELRHVTKNVAFPA